MNDPNATPPSISDSAVQSATGKTWDEWFAVLDAAGAASLDHQSIVKFLREQHEIGDWWQQMVTVTYEQARGLRDKHQKPEGYQIGGSKTIAVPAERLYAAWADEDARARWLPDPALSITKMTPNKSLRAVWVDGASRLDVDFYAKGEGKSQVAVQHSKLADAEAAARMKDYWAEALNRLKVLLEV